MEGAKVEISGGAVVKDLPPTSYNKIPESEQEVEIATKPREPLKAKIGSTEKDGADEKMLPDNEGNVKFMSKEKQNGEAKVDIGELKNTFVGMGKEELMKYANDPFWVRLRWFLFISFWLIWVAMLVGAIVIIVAAPKCSPPEPRTWWEQGPLAEVEIDTNTDELKQISDNGVKGVILTWDGDAYKSFNETDAFTNFLKKTKDIGINVIVDIKPGTSSVWFYKSVNKEEAGAYNDYYIWANARGNDPSDNLILPNNWKSKQNTSAWKFSKERNQFYLSPDATPQLNFSNPKVIDEFSNVLRNLLDTGIKGIRLRGAPQLLIDNKLQDEMISQSPGFGLTDYDFYTHTHTEYVEGLGTLLQGWRDIVKNKTEGGPFMLVENLKNLDVFEVNNSLLIDLPSRLRVFGPNQQLTATHIDSYLNNAFQFLENKYWPLWQHNTSALPLDVLDIVTLLLPGTALVHKNVKVPSELLAMRSSPSVMHGNTNRYLIANQTVFAFGRSTAGNPGYLVVLNPTDKRTIVDLPLEIPAIPEEVTVQYFSNNYNETAIEVKKKTNAHNLPLSPQSAIVMSYVPKS